ncbi:hypothetical protein H8356DRAFT_1322155 [Neocallimastix lanati (nom. inval.)]|nr:hypothetical protein H8356DRAFT_1340947 [Neocallimastix sp. JGI-2020a]KAG4089397.1 hypothetical protein H8356DRAFT_1322155 [Neocallimastix sp. JGI-2020a]
MKFQINQLKFIPNFHKRDGIQLFIIPFEYFNELIENQGFNFNYDLHKWCTVTNFIKALEYGASMNHTTYCCLGNDDFLKSTVKYFIKS